MILSLFISKEMEFNVIKFEIYTFPHENSLLLLGLHSNLFSEKKLFLCIITNNTQGKNYMIGKEVLKLTQESAKLVQYYPKVGKYNNVYNMGYCINLYTVNIL